MLKKTSFLILIIAVLLAGCWANKPVNNKVNITVDFSGAEAMLNILKDVGSGHPDIEMLEEVLDSEGYKHYLAHLNRFKNRHLSRKDFIDIIINLNEQPEGNWKNKFKSQVYKNMKNSIKSINEAQKFIDELKKQEISDYLESEVMAKLPEGTSIYTTIYFVAGGYSPAYVKDGKIGIDVLQMKNKAILMPILKHELHHIGFEYWHNQEKMTKVNKLLYALFSEGTATYFFTRESLFGKKPTQEMYHTLEKDLDLIINNNLDDSEYEKLYSDYVQGYPGNAYIIGTDMCRTIAEAFGEEILIELIKEPEIAFIKKYNEAAEKIKNKTGLEKYIFSSQLINNLEQHQ